MIKTLILLLTFWLCAASCAKAQQPIVVSLTNVPASATSSFSNNTSVRELKRKRCTVYKIGLAAIGTGLVAEGGGIAFIFQAPGAGPAHILGIETDKFGIGLAATGLSLLPVGVGMVIGGSIHDHAIRQHIERISLVAPGKNQWGLAYAF